MPALRERREDIPLLAEHFLAEFSGSLGRKPPAISAEACTCLVDYDWPGNVRELQNVVERAMVMGIILWPDSARDLPNALTHASGAPSGAKPGYARAVQQFKAQLILDALQQARGCFTEAAAILGVHPNYLHRLVTTMDLRDVARKQVVTEMPLRFARV